MPRYLFSSLVLIGLIATASPALAVFLDLRGVTLDSSSQVSAGGVYVHLSSKPNNSTLISTVTRFGIDSPGPNDAPDLLDGGNGIAETLGFLFGPGNAVLESIVISGFDGDDAGTMEPKGSPGIPLINGVNLISPESFSATSLHRILWTGDTKPGVTRGFSIDGFNVRLVPEPTSLALVVSVLPLAYAYRRFQQRRKPRGSDGN